MENTIKKEVIKMIDNLPDIIYTGHGLNLLPDLQPVQL